jgi:hypothetical protein
VQAPKAGALKFSPRVLIPGDRGGGPFKDKRAFGAGAASGWPRHRNKSGRLDPNAAVVMSPPDACYAKYIPLSSVTNPNRLFASSPSPGGAGGVPLPLSKTLDLLFPEGVTGAEAPPRQRLTI